MIIATTLTDAELRNEYTEAAYMRARLVGITTGTSTASERDDSTLLSGLMARLDAKGSTGVSLDRLVEIFARTQSLLLHEIIRRALPSQEELDLTIPLTIKQGEAA